ncbi:MAG: peptide chain release factor N(5)-glutamine methyltransferase [Lachnospiraceae bacterium]|nr:peptide chain release factor N(5)-glutamine methyltransferase [Lachnospiraceae bacterium]
MTYSNAYQEAVKFLRERNVPDPEVDAKLLIEIYFKDSVDYLLRQNEEMPQEEYEAYQKHWKERSLRKPVQYILGEAYFYGNRFVVTPDVLIPRFDTEVLVEEAHHRLKSYEKEESVKILDLCTGSGCIAITLGLLHPRAKVTGVDISSRALEVARKNALLLDASNVEMVESNLFENLSTKEKYHMIISNPPYISKEEMEGLMPEVYDYEPHLALEAKDRGLWFYEEITRQAMEWLEPYGILLFEIGCKQHKAVEAIMKQYGFREIVGKKDLAGLDRVICGIKE